MKCSGVCFVTDWILEVSYTSWWPALMAVVHARTITSGQKSGASDS